MDPPPSRHTGSPQGTTARKPADRSRGRASQVAAAEYYRRRQEIELASIDRSIALEREKEIIAGVIYQPISDELFVSSVTATSDVMNSDLSAAVVTANRMCRIFNA